MCSVLENGSDDHREFILKQVRSNVQEMSVDRDGSKLLENTIKMIGEERTAGKKALEAIQQDILDKIVNIPMQSNIEAMKSSQDGDQVDPSNVHFNNLLTNKFGNYIVQTAFQKGDESQRIKILRNIKLTLQAV